MSTQYKNDPDDIVAWLQQSPGLAELRARFPAEWDRVQARVAGVIAQGRPEELKALTERPPAKRPRSPNPASRQARSDLLAEHVRHRMTCLLIKQYSLSVATGVAKGKVRFNVLNGYLAQRLLFSKGLERKMTSMLWFHLVWPFIRQKRLLMPLVESRGIYCFYSRELIDGLVALIGSGSCIEIAAGDGTLSRFLNCRGTRVTATDNHSWKQSIHYGDSVALCDARAALEKYRPEVVVCSWPPAGNDFERHVFRTVSVHTYIVIGSRYQSASGNWAEYKAQTAFSFEEDVRLGGLVLPPELGAAVYIFRRKTRVS